MSLGNLDPNTAWDIMELEWCPKRNNGCCCNTAKDIVDRMNGVDIIDHEIWLNDEKGGWVRYNTFSYLISDGLKV